MKKKLFIYLLLLLPMFTFQSCLKDQEDIFDKDASLRVQDAMDNADKAFVSAENGWILDYYPEEEQSYGGYAVTVKFADGKAVVGGELDTENTYESLYKMTNDQGPVLTFDSYNEIMHYFATPSNGNYEAMHGDFEFVVDSVGTDVIKVHGKKTQNVLYFRKLQTSAEEYINKVMEVEDNFIVSGLEGSVGDVQLLGEFDLDYRQLLIANADGSNAQQRAFVFTDKGIRFYKPFVIDGEQLESLDYNAESNAFSGMTSKGTTISLQGTLPEGYVKYDEYAGDYYLYYNPHKNDAGKTVYNYFNVTLTPTEDKSGYIMEGLNDNIKPVLKFNKGKGNLELNSQIVGSYGGNNVWLCAWGIAAGGNLTWATGAGMETVWNLDAEHPRYLFKSNSYSGLVTDSYILWSVTTAGSSAGQFSNAAWMMNGSNRLPYLYGLIKK